MKHPGFGFIFISAVIFLTGCRGGLAGDGNTASGMQAIEAQDYTTALTCFENALSSGEDARLDHRGMGIAYMGLGEYEQAVKEFKTALSYSNGIVSKVDYDINYYLAMARYKSGDIDGALSTYDAILALNDKAADAHYLRGRIELLKNDKQAAISDFDRAVELKGGDYDLYINIYEGLKASGFDSEAEGYIKAALEKNGKMTKVQSGLFSYYLGDYDEARNSLENARNSNESDMLILYLGRSYEALGDVNYASNLYSEYIGKGSAGASIYNELGLINLKREMYDEALEAFEAGMALNDPAYTQSLMFNEAVTYEYLLDFKKAGVLMKEYLERFPDDEEAQREYVFLSTR
ncbi:MAG: tetratricopeptide repeat protein [Lachnospiraceae bacterium]|nr:tetratricopeptide repeat protein [Lachnospiraceae bacterium]